MEYLMTYGWALLIIAVVLVALFQLGVFGSATSGPRAVAGACQVIKTVAGSSLQGECQGELPQFVAYFPGSNLLNTNNIVTGAVSGISGSNPPFTVTGWVELPAINVNPSTDWMEPFVGFSNIYQDAGIFNATSTGSASPLTMVWHRCSSADTCSTNGFCGLQSSVNNQITQSFGGFFGKWQFFAYSFDYPNYYFQLDSQSSTAVNNGNGNDINFNTGDLFYIGGYGSACGESSMRGYLSNIQLYNISLSSNEIQALYLEGIGGAPIRPQNLVGWWPLNGNTNDYSGNNNQGIVRGEVTYTSQWTSGYTQP